MIFQITSKKLGTHDVIIDDADADILPKYSWYLWQSPRHYGIYVLGYQVGSENKAFRIHRLIMNTNPNEIVDHINGNPLDNRRENLRITSSAVNNQNARKRKDGVTSRFKGVCWYSPTKRWRAQIQLNKKKIGLGYVSSEEEARAAYVKFANEHGVVLSYDSEELKMIRNSRIANKEGGTPCIAGEKKHVTANG